MTVENEWQFPQASNKFLQILKNFSMKLFVKDEIHICFSDNQELFATGKIVLRGS